MFYIYDSSSDSRFGSFDTYEEAATVAPQIVDEGFLDDYDIVSTPDYLDTLDAHCLDDGEFGGNPYVLIRMDDGSYFTVWTDSCDVEPLEFGPYPS